MTTTSVLITDYLTETNIEDEIFQSQVHVEALNALSEEEILPHANRADALLVYHEINFSASTIEQLTKCKVMVRCGVGFDNIDLEAAGNAGIVVCNVPDYGTEEVADHAILMLLAIARRLVDCNHAIKNGVWDSRIAFGTPRLRGRTLGLLGCGRIGTATALRAKAFGLHIIFYDPYQPRGHDKALGLERVDSLEELLSRSEFLSLHCPLTTETHHILHRETLALLPKGAMVINTARGPCIDLDALADALEQEHLFAAGLDVVEPEPLTHERIRNHPRVLLTPHVAYYSVEGLREMRSKGASEVLRALQGEVVHNPVNLPWLKNPRCLVSRV